MMTTIAAFDRSARALPSVDWIAFGVGALGLALQYSYPPTLVLVALAVFLPSILRELGVLKDADEFTVGIMHRAGFHALLAVTGLIFLNHLLPAVAWFDLDQSQLGREPFGGEALRKAVVWTFLLSYLIQYWGPRRGVTRTLLGVALMLMASLVGLIRHFSEQGPLIIAVTVAAATIFVAAAALVHRRPRAGGYGLLLMGGSFVAFVAQNLGDPRVAWGMLSVLMQATLVFGVTGLSLLRSGSVDGD